MQTLWVLISAIDQPEPQLLARLIDQSPLADWD